MAPAALVPASPHSFEAVVNALFAKLGLGSPRFDATGIVRLRIDGQGVNLSSDGRGHVIVEAVVGRLPDDPQALRRWRTNWLRTAPGLLLVNESGSFVRQQGAVSVLVAQGRLRLRAGLIEPLERLIEDVLAQADRQSVLLGEGQRGPTTTAPVVRETESEAIIFRL
jgi:hypothetical protein